MFRQKTFKSNLKNNKAMASIEAAMLLVVFAVILGFTVGTFGVIHTSIINSIAARAYTFETFDNRADLTYFRSMPMDDVKATEHYYNYGFRIHGIGNEVFASTWTPTERSISAFTSSGAEEEGRDVAVHNESIDTYKPEQTREQIAVNPVWIKTTYGICLNTACGAGEE